MPPPERSRSRPIRSTASAYRRGTAGRSSRAQKLGGSGGLRDCRTAVGGRTAPRPGYPTSVPPCPLRRYPWRAPGRSPVSVSRETARPSASVFIMLAIQIRPSSRSRRWRSDARATRTSRSRSSRPGVGSQPIPSAAPADRSPWPPPRAGSPCDAAVRRIRHDMVVRLVVAIREVVHRHRKTFPTPETSLSVTAPRTISAPSSSTRFRGSTRIRKMSAAGAAIRRDTATRSLIAEPVPLDRRNAGPMRRRARLPFHAKRAVRVSRETAGESYCPAVPGRPPGFIASMMRSKSSMEPNSTTILPLRRPMSTLTFVS